MPATPPGESAHGRLIFLGGCPRSGLTLLRLILDAHPEISIGPDAGIFSIALTARDFAATLGELHRDHFNLPPERVRANFAEAIEKILDARRRRFGRARAGEKSLANLLVFEDLAKLFPAAQFIHCVRDGRDVAASLLERAWKDPRTGRLFDHCADAGAAARYWADFVAIGLEAERRIGKGKRLYRFSYEKLAREPEPAMRGLFRFLSVDWSDAALAYHEREPQLAGIEEESTERLRRPITDEQVGRWRRDLDAAQQRDVAAAAGRMLRALGYTQ